ISAYANGVNAFHATSMQALPPEFHILHVMPGEWTPQDTVAWVLMMALDLGGNWGTEFARLSALQNIDTQQLWQLMPPYPGEAPATKVDLAALYRSLGVYRTDGTAAKKTVQSFNELDTWREGLGHLEGVGSNNWVVSGTHTQSGKPLLANDPHLALSAPAIWYFAHIHAPELNAIGATVPGVPGVLLGRNERIAWSATNTGPDVQDLYLERLDAAARYRTPDGWREFETRREIIRVKGAPEVELTVRASRHGPVISDVVATASATAPRGHVLALAWTALAEDDVSLAALFRMPRARNWPQFLEATRALQAPQQNL